MRTVCCSGLLILGGGWCLPGVSTQKRVSVGGGGCLGGLPRGCLLRMGVHPPFTHACGNITFPQLRLLMVIILHNYRLFERVELHLNFFSVYLEMFVVFIDFNSAHVWLRHIPCWKICKYQSHP